MGMNLTIAAGALLVTVAAMAIWAWVGPYAGALVTGAAFYLGAMVALIAASQGRT